MLQRCYPGSKYKQNRDSVTRLDVENRQIVSDLVKIMIHYTATAAAIMHNKVAYFNILQF